MDYDTIQILATSLGLGLLVGLQREYTAHKVAGIRTFSLITLTGTVLAMLGQQTGSYWLLAAGAIGLVAILVTGNILKAHNGKVDVGQTTEVAGLLMYGLGAYLVEGSLVFGVMIGGLTAVLLHLKDTLDDLVGRMSKKDIVAIMQFTAISLIVLPILPDEAYGPYQVLNPRSIWLMVVLIVGLGLTGYFLYKLLGQKAGTVSCGILGGMISSTATTVTYSERAKSVPAISRITAFVVYTASTVALLRIMVEVAVVSPQYFGTIAPPLGLVLLIMIALAFGLYYYNRPPEQEVREISEPENPAQLKTALIFAGLYAIILLGVAAAKDWMGEGGLLVVSIISGFTDVDAITLSLANTLNRGEIEVQQAWQYMLIASFSNLLFKGGMVVVIGSRRMAQYILPTFAISIIAGVLVILFWPAHWVF